MTDIHGDAPLYAVGALPADEAERFEAHLSGCAQCRAEVQSTRDLAAVLTRSVPVAPPAHLRASILTRIAETPQEHPGGSGGQPPTTESSPTTEGSSADDDTSQVGSARQPVVALPHRPSRSAGWRKVPSLVAAVAVLIAVAGGVWGWQSHRAAVRADQQQQLISRLISSPDSISRTARMVNGGRGAVILSHAQRKAIFVGTDLPTPGEKQVYQLWTITSTPESAGVITSHDSTVVVALPSAALAAHSVAITVEKQGGSAAPTGQPVMTFQLS